MGRIKDCDPNDIALKSFFLGPQAENAPMVAQMFDQIIGRWIQWRRTCYPTDGCAISSEDQNTPEYQNDLNKINAVANDLLSRFESEVPKFSPRYIGHMFSEISLPALFGHIISLLHNPNNVSAEASRVGSKIEKEAIGELLKMCGFDVHKGAGHFTSGGTVANFEAVVRAKWRMSHWLSMAAMGQKQKIWSGTFFDAANLGWQQFEHLRLQVNSANIVTNHFDFYNASPTQSGQRIVEQFGVYHDPVLLIPEHRHYSWDKIAVLLGYGKENLLPVSLDKHGTMSVSDLKRKIEFCRKQERPISMIVSVLGTTEMGLVDPVYNIQQILNEYRKNQNLFIWHHIDAAFGGFFCSLKDSVGIIDEQFRRNLNAVSMAESTTIDPHKLGYVPYACGAFLLKDKRENQLPIQDTPYIDFHETDVGHFTLEGSRSAAGATATWLTAKTIGLNADGYGRILRRTVDAARILRQTLKESIKDIHTPASVDTNILCFCVGKPGEPLSFVNARTQRMFERFSPYVNSDFYVSKTNIDLKKYSKFLAANFPDWSPQNDSTYLMLIRVCLMNPFFTSIEPKVNYPQAFADSLAKFLNSSDSKSAAS